MLIVTVDELKRYTHKTSRGNAVDSTEETAQYEDALYWAQGSLWAYTHYSARQTVTDEKHDANSIIYPKHLPIVSVSEVKYSDSAMNSENYYTYERYIRVPSIDTRTPLAIALSYVGGVSRDDVEPDSSTGLVDTSTVGYKYTVLVQAAIKQLAEWYLKNNINSQKNSADEIMIRDMIYKYLPQIILF